MAKKPEILSPAGSIGGIYAAVAAGCDAVYTAAARFGARAYADNLTQEQLLEAIAYCHLHGVKLYLTVNTLLKEKEIQGLSSFLAPYYEAGLDAVIVQDVGVLRLISRRFPALAVHASTQMTLTAAQGTEWIKNYNVTRIVPARELSVRELCAMREKTDLELEVFVHGALCYCYSGQCLLSSMHGGRSGNRGRCAQPCRLPYQGKYLLSPKELCALPYLPELIEAGVDSFKIEGRMKRMEYTAFVTSVYRKYTDLFMALGKEGYREYLAKHEDTWEEDLRCLAELYNREGFTQGYLAGKAGDILNRQKGKHGKMLAAKRPGHGGVCVGKVLSVGKGELVYRADKVLSAQDVVEFRDTRGQACYAYTLGQGAGKGARVRARFQKGSKINVGDKVYRMKDARLLEQIQKDYLFGKKQVSVTGSFTAETGKPICLTITGRMAGKSYTVQETGEICREAQKQPADTEAVRRVLSQTGDTPFFFENLDVELAGSPFLAVSVLKKLRRQGIQQLEDTMRTACARSFSQDAEEEQEIPRRKQAGQTVYTASVLKEEQLAPVLGEPKIAAVYLGTEQMDAGQLKEAYHRTKEAGKQARLALPVIFREAARESFFRESKKQDGLFAVAWDGFLVKNMESITFLTNDLGIEKEKIRLDANLYVMNTQAYRFWSEQGFCAFTAPLEASCREMQAFPFLSQMEFVQYGRPLLMTSAQCVLANTKGCRAGEGASAIRLQDERKRAVCVLPCCKYCYNMIVQEEPIFLQDAEALGASSLRYAFTTEDAAQTAQALNGKPCEKTQTGHFWQEIE